MAGWPGGRPRRWPISDQSSRVWTARLGELICSDSACARSEVSTATGRWPLAYIRHLQGAGTAAPGDVYAQSVRCPDIAEQSLRDAGASLADVVRTRVILADIG